MKEQFCITGEVESILVNAQGERIGYSKESNLVTLLGRDVIVSRMMGSGNLSAPRYIAIGTGLSNPTVNDDSLPGEYTAGRQFATASSNGSVITYSAVFGAGYVGNVKSAGLFTESTSGVGDDKLVAKIGPNSINYDLKTTDDTLTINWTLTLGINPA